MSAQMSAATLVAAIATTIALVWLSRTRRRLGRHAAKKVAAVREMPGLPRPRPPVAARPAWLRTRIGSTPDMLLTESPIIVGRSRDCDVQVDDPLVSRRHIKLDQHQHGWYITDLGACNGTFLNDRSIESFTPLRVSSGDMVTIGGAAFELIVCDDNTEPIPVRSESDAVRRSASR
jgi:hypothetical protein